MKTAAPWWERHWMVDNCLWFWCKAFLRFGPCFVQLKIHKNIREAKSISGPENSFTLSKSEDTSALINNNQYWFWRHWPCNYSITNWSRVLQGHTPLNNDLLHKNMQVELPLPICLNQRYSWCRTHLCRYAFDHYDNHFSQRCDLNDAATALQTCGCVHVCVNDSDSAAKLTVTDLFCKCSLIVISFCPFSSWWFKAISESRVNNFENVSAAQHNFSGGLTVFIKNQKWKGDKSGHQPKFSCPVEWKHAIVDDLCICKRAKDFDSIYFCFH